MRRTMFFALSVFLAATACAQPPAAGGRGMRGRFSPSAQAPLLARNEAEKKIVASLEEFARSGQEYLNVPASDGRMLRMMVELSGAKHAIEIGTSTGYSGLWLSLGLVSTGGRLTTFEIDEGRAATARETFRKAGAPVTVVLGDAHEKLRELKGPIDLVFIDADKEGYVDYLKKVLPQVRAGGVILAHNMNLASTSEYGQMVTTNPDLETVFYNDGGGLAITVKKR